MSTNGNSTNGNGNGDGDANGNAGNGGNHGKRRHTFVAHVEDGPGVLNRVASLFRRRGYNIESLTVGKCKVSGLSRMTIVLDADDTTARLMEANLYKLVNVLRVEDVTYANAVLRDLALIKVRATPERRHEILRLLDVFRARVVDIGPETLVIEITGSEDKIMGLADVLEPFGVVEMVRTGVVAMTRGADAVDVKPRARFDHERVTT